MWGRGAISLFDRQIPRVYNSPAGVPLVDVLACGLLDHFKDDLEGFSRALILVPTRRAVLALRTALLRASDGNAMIMPRMRALGDVDEDELVLSLIPGIADKDISLDPAIDGFSRLMLLALQVQKAAPGLGFGQMSLATALQMAKALGGLLDSVQIEELSFEKLTDLADESLADHWQITVDFLKIITDFWPEVLNDLSLMDPAERRTHALKILTEFWRQNPPDYPVIVAGSTGSVPATADLISVVSRLPKGAVLLPAFDQNLPEDCWNALDATHPQATMKNLLDTMRCTPLDVTRWPLRDYHKQQIDLHHERLTMIQRALWPASTIDQWLSSDHAKLDVKKAMQGLSYVTAETVREEATIIALMMRAKLEEEGVTTALVTPDRHLARRVKQELKRWQIEVDDSAGDPLSLAPPSTLIMLLVEVLEKDFAPVALLSLLKHPMVALGQNRGKHINLTRHLEKRLLRGVRPAHGLDGLMKALEGLDDNRISTARRARLKAFINCLKTAFKPAFELAGDADFHGWLKAMLMVAENLCQTDERSGDAILWAQENGHALANFMHRLFEGMVPNFDLDPADRDLEFGALLATLMKGEVVRRQHSRHPRLAIWGTIEARMQQADVMILAGMNEESWPPAIADDPWMSRPMRAKFGLPPLERRVGLSAHDFVQACGAKEVIITRSEKADGAEAVASRWLLRLEAMMGDHFAKSGQHPWADLSVLLDHSNSPGSVLPPSPKPPVHVRPTQLSVTEVQSLMRDPYSIYASKILALKKWEDLEQKPNAADKGNIIHDALEKFIKSKPKAFKEQQQQELIEIGRQSFGAELDRPGVWAFWWPRFEQVAAEFIRLQDQRQAHYDIVFVEEKRDLTFGSGDDVFILRAKADRVDYNHTTKAYEVIDYKSGGIPSKEQIMAGYAPQLPLEGYMIQQGAFEMAHGDCDELAFWRVSGGPTPIEIKACSKMRGVEVADLISDAGQGLMELIAAFKRPTMPYLCNPRPTIAGYGDYDHLARVKEWRVSDEGGD